MGSQVVAITGGATGIGRAAAVTFTKKGASPIGVMRWVGRFVTELRSFGSEAKFIYGDVREDDVRAMADKAVAR